MSLASDVAIRKARVRLRVIGELEPALAQCLIGRYPEIELVPEASLAEPADALFAWSYDWARILRVVGDGPAPAWLHIKSAGVPPPLLATLERLPDTILTNGSGPHAPAVAEYAVATLLALYKRLPALQELQRNAEWDPRFQLTELRGRTVGILGLGDVGRAIARLLRPFGVRLLGIRRHPGAVPEVDRVYPRQELPAFLGQLDVLVLAAALTPETRKMIGAPELAALPRGALLINVARGEVIDEDALIAALTSGHLAGAALDVFAKEPLPATSPLWGLANVIVSPHSADHTRETPERAFELFLDNLGAYIRGEPLLNIVDRQLAYAPTRP